MRLYVVAVLFCMWERETLSLDIVAAKEGESDVGFDFGAELRSCLVLYRHYRCGVIFFISYDELWAWPVVHI